MKVLVVDDNQRLNQMLVWHLEDQGHQVFSSPNYRQAQLIIEHYELDLALLDYCLPDGEGVDLINAIKEHQNACISIIMSSVSEPNIVDRSLDLGAQSFLPKPIDIDCLNLICKKAQRV